MLDRKTSKTLEIEGRKFVLNQFDPLFGSYFSFKMMAISNVHKLSPDMILSNLTGNSYEEFETNYKKILKYCSEILPSGKVPLINEEGNIAITNFAPALAIQLSLELIMFNLDGFFEREEIPETPQVLSPGN